MRSSIVFVSVVLVAAVLISGCALTTPFFMMGGIYSDYKGPLGVTANSGSSKVGTSSAASILGWIATGDASIEAAAKNGGITKIQHVDYQTSNILGIYAKIIVTVYGD